MAHLLRIPGHVGNLAENEIDQMNTYREQSPVSQKRAGAFLATLVVSLTLGATVFGAGLGFVPGQILIKPRRGVPEPNVQAILSANAAHQVGEIRQIEVRVVSVPVEHWSRVLNALNHNPNIEFAEPNYLLSPETVPNDPFYPYAWHLPKIGAPAAWDVTTGSSNIVIAILDSGVEATHPDLAPLLIPGWNFYDNNADTRDVTGHGTPVAGAAAAAGNNGQGVAGVAWGCRIMPVRICDTNGYASLSMIANGLTWAADHGARVANISFRASSGSTITSAAQYFQSKGGVVTVSAGNNGIFDSAADNLYVLTVSATDADDAVASFSNTGNNVDLAAPGVNLETTTTGGDYGSGTGTSFSAPVVAGVAALVLSANPTLSGSQVQQILKNSADDLGAAGWDTSYGWGRANASNAVRMAVSAVAADTIAPSATITSPGAGAAVSNIVSIQVNASDNVGVARVELVLNGAAMATNATVPAAFSWDTTKYTNGSYTLQAGACDAADNYGVSASVVVYVQNPIAPVNDNIAPAAQITSPLNGAIISGKTTKVYATASDNVGVTRVDLVVDGKFYASSSVSSPVFTCNLSKLARGSHFLQVIARDAAGNLTRSTPVIVSK
jgi:thermitase